jgi:GTP cyclohydrolase I
VLARAIPFRTVCEHHLLPFSGLAHVGYLPGERIVGLSKLARLVEHFAAWPQVQERLTKQVAECLAAGSGPGVGVVLEAEHSCMTVRGVRAHGAKTVTSSTKRFRHSTVWASSSHAAARMILAAVASYDLRAFDALQRVNARGTFVVIQQASLQP